MIKLISKNSFTGYSSIKLYTVKSVFNKILYDFNMINEQFLCHAKNGKTYRLFYYIL